MIVTSPLYSLKAWKGLSESAISTMYHVEGSGIFRRNGNRTILNAWYIPTNPQTSLQQSGRSAFRLAVASWQALSDRDKQKWNYYQDHRKRRPVMEGYNLFISKFLLTGGNPQLPEDMRTGFPYTFPFTFS